MTKRLTGHVAVVAGATRGAGRGIAAMLGEAGATVYCTGRSSRTTQGGGLPGRPETIEETAELVTARGGQGIPVRCDHLVEAEVKALFERVAREQDGRLDLIVNDIWGGEKLSHWGTPFWEQPLADGLRMQELAIRTHLITSYYGAPLLVARRQGLIVEITDGLDYKYRGNLYYSLTKISAIHMAEGLAAELRPYGVAAVAVTPGFLRSEEMLEHFGVTEANWRDAVAKEPHFAEAETPFYVGRGVAALAADPGILTKSGKAFMSGDLAEEYGFRDVDGRQPNWRAYYAKYQAEQE